VKRLLITGADGFVGRWLVRAARSEGHQVIAAIMPGASPPDEWRETGASPAVEVVHADFRESEDVDRLAGIEAESVVHLAAVASGAQARENPDVALQVNGAMTAFFGDQLSRRSQPPRFLFVSTGEVYGPAYADPIPETAPRNPKSPYAVSKAGAEMPLELFHRDSGFPVIIARAFPHTGPGQSTTYVLPALAARLREAKRTGGHTVPAGNLSAVRDFLDVRDVVRAYLLLLDKGVPGEIYNVASGVGRRLSDCFDLLARIVGVDARAEQDATLLRPGDIPVLVGDPAKLRAATGWSPEIPFERTLQDLVNAQAD
jgi:GDP-4-dehydro-6-deoxy-D-mannose reductase